MFIEIRLNGTLGVEVTGSNPPFRLSDGRRILGPVTLENCYRCPTEDGTLAELWPVALLPPPEAPHRFALDSNVDAKNEGEQRIDRTVVWDKHVTVESAYTQVKADLDRRWLDALDRGIPYSVALNGDTLHALLRYDEVDRLVWGTHGYGMPAPTGGLLIALKQPLVAPGKPYDGKDEFAISGQQRLDGGKLAIRDHVNAASKAWETGKDEAIAIRDGAGTESERVEALANYNVEALAWPSNELPSAP